MSNKRIALLIDGQNVSFKYMDMVMGEVSNYGEIVISNLYNDIEKLKKEKEFDQWQAFITKYGITSRFHFNVAAGKNAADIEVVVDAMKILRYSDVDIFFIVSSDSDFTPLVKELKAHNKAVYVIGFENASPALKNACSKFISIAVLEANTSEEDKNLVPEGELIRITELIRSIIRDSSENNKLLLSELGSVLSNKEPSFDVRKFGVAKLSNFIELLDGIDIITHNNIHYAALNEMASIEEVKQFIQEKLSDNKKHNIPGLLEHIVKEFDGFRYQDYGFTKFSTLLSSIENVEVKKHDVFLIKQ